MTMDTCSRVSVFTPWVRHQSNHSWVGQQIDPYHSLIATVSQGILANTSLLQQSTEKKNIVFSRLYFMQLSGRRSCNLFIDAYSGSPPASKNFFDAQIIVVPRRREKLWRCSGPLPQLPTSVMSLLFGSRPVCSRTPRPDWRMLP